MHVSICRISSSNRAYASKSKCKIRRHEGTSKKIENVLRNNALNPVENKDVYITQFLPLDTIDRIKKFETLLKGTEEAVIEFVSLFC